MGRELQNKEIGVARASDPYFLVLAGCLRVSLFDLLLDCSNAVKLIGPALFESGVTCRGDLRHAHGFRLLFGLGLGLLLGLRLLAVAHDYARSYARGGDDET